MCENVLSTAIKIQTLVRLVFESSRGYFSQYTCNLLLTTDKKTYQTLRYNTLNHRDINHKSRKRYAIT